MKYKVYAFDFDLTLADTIEVSCETYRRSFATVGATFCDKDVFHHLTQDIGVTFNEINDGKHDFQSFLKYFERIAAESFDRTTLYPDVLPVIKRLKENGAKIALITNRHIDSISGALEKYGGTKSIFDYAVTGDITENFKPHPEPVLKCLKKAGVDKSEMVYIGDAENDCRSATAAGVDFIFVDRHGQVKDLSAIKSLEELF